MIVVRMVLAACLLALCACASAPPGKRLAAVPDFAPPTGGVAVVDIEAELGQLTTRGHVAHDPSLSAAAAAGLREALVGELAARGVEARAIVMPLADPEGDALGDAAQLRALLALADLRAAVHEAGLAPHRAALAGRPIRFADALRDATGTDHVLVGVASGTYATQNRRLTQAVGAAMTVGVGFGYMPSSGGQYVVLGLYDLGEDRLLWIHKDDFVRYSLRRETDRARIARQLLAPLTADANEDGEGGQ